MGGTSRFLVSGWGIFAVRATQCIKLRGARDAAKCRRYLCLRTERRRIRAYAALMLANRPVRGNHETQRNSQPEITQTSDRLE